MMKKFTLLKEESLLFIIDIQERLVPAMKNGEEVIDNTNILIAAAKEMKVPIIVTEQYPKGLGPTVPEIEKNLKDVQKFEKTMFSACTDGVVGALESKGKKKIIITGMETHVCVFQTVRDLIDLGYEVYVVSDGVSSRYEKNYRNGLELMRNIGAVITDTETVIFDLLKEAGTPSFKVLSKLIK